MCIGWLSIREDDKPCEKFTWPYVHCNNRPSNDDPTHWMEGGSNGGLHNAGNNPEDLLSPLEFTQDLCVRPTLVIRRRSFAFPHSSHETALDFLRQLRERRHLRVVQNREATVENPSTTRLSP